MARTPRPCGTGMVSRRGSCRVRVPSVESPSRGYLRAVPVSLFENKPSVCPFGHQLGPGRFRVSWKPCICEPAQQAAGRGRGMGHAVVRCRACEDEHKTTVYYEPPHDTKGLHIRLP